MALDLRSVDLSAFYNMTSEQLADTFGEDELQAIYEYGRYITLYPKECSGDLLKFTRYNQPDPDHLYSVEHSLYVVAQHHRLIAEAFESVLQGKCLRLILCVPPQFGKSTLAKHMLGAHVGRFPWKHLIFGTYNQTFADENGDDVRSIIQGEAFQRTYPHVTLRPGSKAKDHMVTNKGGKLAFIGRGSAGAGRPADGLLIDDPFKDDREARSKTIRDDAWTWFTRVANARCHALTWQIIISTRWSDDDIIARLTDPKNPYYNADVAKQWTVINIPAIVDDEELARALGLVAGQSLWPERFPKELLETARKMDPVGFSALYMGRPTPPEGSFYQHYMLHTYDSAAKFPKRARMYMSGDLAVSPHLRADKTCVGVWGVDENNELWLHPELYWGKKSSDESVDRIIDMGCRFEAMELFWEKGQIDKAVGPFLKTKMQEALNEGRRAYFGLTTLPVTGDKGARSLAFRGRASQQKVHFPDFTEWWPAAKEQMLKFTGSGDDKEDDFCDMCALIGQALELQIPASGAPTNVIALPKVGTFGWTIWKHRQEQAAKARRAGLRGM